MLPPHGSAPVHLDQLIHQLATAVGARPRPVAGKSEVMIPVPVVLRLYTGSGTIEVPLSNWMLVPYQPALRDDAGAVVQLEQHAKLVLGTPVPKEFKLVPSDQFLALTPEPEPAPSELPPLIEQVWKPATTPPVPGVFDGTYQHEKGAAGYKAERVPNQGGET